MDRLTLAVVAANKPTAMCLVGYTDKAMYLRGNGPSAYCARCMDTHFSGWLVRDYWVITGRAVSFARWKWWWSIPWLGTSPPLICQACCHVFTKGDIWTG